MKRSLIVIVIGGLLTGAVALSSQAPPPAAEEAKVFSAVTEDRNPWTNLKFNNKSENFQFVIVTDRTGGHRPNVFSKAVEQINLLQPEFVLSVGDLIEGYTEDKPRLQAEWDEFNGFLSGLQMPFFYVPGNHDITNQVMRDLWETKFGREYYHFTYKGVLFLCLATDDPPGTGAVSKGQIEYFKEVLRQNPSPRWTVVAMHKPLWVYGNVRENGWPEIEEALQGRNYTVFAGHVHRYQKYERNGMRYYELATTGGGSRLRGVEYGEFDHLVWVTMKDDGPVLANIMLDGILPENLRVEAPEEPGNPRWRNKQPTYPVTGRVLIAGRPAEGAQVSFYLIDPRTRRFTYSGDARVGPDGRYEMTTYSRYDGAVEGEFKVVVGPARGFPGEERTLNPIEIPDAYRDVKTTPLTVRVKPEPNEFDIELKP